MQSTVRKWGNSLAIRIPTGYAKDFGLQEGSGVDFLNKAGQLVIIPTKNILKLSDLLANVTTKNIHREEFTGDAVGKEIW